MRERLPNLLPPLLGDQAGQRVLSRVRLARPALQPAESLVAATFRAAPLHTDVPRGLEKKRRKRFAVLDPSRAQRLERAPEDLLGDVLGGISIAQAASCKKPDPVAETLGQFRGKGVRVGVRLSCRRSSFGRGVGRVVRLERRTIARVTVTTER